mmetsp:Transcript_3147/g.8118  ORF Transcript_3147/g.8118 Transcript_3147/m.8118 type:complete len:320 (-) Transcript_3147:58-1017(-)
MLNLLIAMLDDTWGMFKGDMNKQWRMQFAQRVLLIENSLSRKEKEVPDRITFMEKHTDREEQAKGQSDLERRMGALENGIQNVTKKLEELALVLTHEPGQDQPARTHVSETAASKSSVSRALRDLHTVRQASNTSFLSVSRNNSGNGFGRSFRRRQSSSTSFQSEEVGPFELRDPMSAAVKRSERSDTGNGKDKPLLHVDANPTLRRSDTGGKAAVQSVTHRVTPSTRTTTQGDTALQRPPSLPGLAGTSEEKSEENLKSEEMSGVVPSSAFDPSRMLGLTETTDTNIAGADSRSSHGSVPRSPRSYKGPKSSGVKGSL